MDINEKYDIGEVIIDYGNKIKLYLGVRESDGEEYEILMIEIKKNQKREIKRIIDNEIKPLINSKHKGIQSVIECIENDDKFYIIYEAIEKQEICQDRDSFEQSINILDALKKENRYGFILNKDILILDERQVKLRFAGLLEVFKLLEVKVDDNTIDSQKTKDDIKSLALVFKQYLNNTEETNKIYDKCMNKMYAKYSDLIDNIDNIPPEENVNLKTMGISIDESKNDIDYIVSNLNKGFYYEVQNKKSKNDDIEINWSTKNISGKAFIIEAGHYIFIPHINEKQNTNLLIADKKAQFNFKNRNELGDDSDIDCFIEEFYKVNELAELHKKKKDKIHIWKTLPEKEKEYIEEQAFSANYTERTLSKRNELNVIFKLEKNFKDWDVIKNKKNKNTILSVGDSEIGEILEYRQKEDILIIKDRKLDINEIPKKGKIIEDVRQLTSQYKKQIEACEKLQTKDIFNPNLAGFIATPERIPDLSRTTINYEEYSSKIINNELKNDKTQKNAVIDATYKEPAYLIQGPPGTGKTTVIVEMVQQLINRNKDTKILIVSQSNLAVDNVLERLPKDILFMRLASEHAINKDNVTQSMKGNLFGDKLKKWIQKTSKRSDDNLKDKFPNINEVLVNFYTNLQLMESKKIEYIKKEYRQGKGSNYLEKLFDKCQTMESIKKVCTKELGEDFIIYQKLQKEWLSFIANSDNDKSESFLHNGSEKISLKMAFMKKINVFGATCIHIASSQYSKIDFKFDYMIMDESSKATSAEALVPITMAKNIILIGDHHQLPPMVTREDAIKNKVKKQLEDNGLDIDKTYGKSLFEDLIVEFEKSNILAPYKTMLDIQYRMPRQLGYLISKYIYDGELHNPDIKKIPNYDNDKFHKLKFKKPFVSIENEDVFNSIVFVSTSKQNNPYDNDDKYKRKNPCNAKSIEETLGVLEEHLGNKLNIGIIAGYRGQVELLKNKLPQKYKSCVNTVDKFQGAERNIIIYDIVKSSRGNSNIGFLEDYRRINVAFSRAKKLLIVVGDSEYVLRRAKQNPNVAKNQHTKELVIKSMVEQLDKWGCIYDSLKDALK